MLLISYLIFIVLCVSVIFLPCKPKIRVRYAPGCESVSSNHEDSSDWALRAWWKKRLRKWWWMKWKNLCKHSLFWVYACACLSVREHMCMCACARMCACACVYVYLCKGPRVHAHVYVCCVLGCVVCACVQARAYARVSVWVMHNFTSSRSTGVTYILRMALPANHSRRN